MTVPMDHPHYVYSPIVERPRPAGLPAGRVMAFAVLFVEHWDFVAPEGALRDPRLVGEFGSFHPDYRSHSQREYGLRLGVFRVLEALAEAGIRPAVAASALAVRRLPGLVRQLEALGCEWVAHGLAATRIMHARMPIERQQQHIALSLEVLSEATGRAPLGWLSQDWGTTPDTYRLLAQAGLRYTLDWTNDEQPYWLEARAAASEPPLLAVPLSAEWDDVQSQWLRQVSPREHSALALQALRALRAEACAGQTAKVFGLALHPWVVGMPNRIAALRDLLRAGASLESVDWVTPGEIHARMSAAMGAR